jgi:hypothetical protein
MQQKNWRFLVGFFSVIFSYQLGIVVKAHPPEQHCLAQYGYDPHAGCPVLWGQQCWCDTNALPRPGYCCATVIAHEETHCCVYNNAPEVYPCRLPDGSACGYAGCTDPNGPGCGNPYAVVGECEDDPTLPSYASCREVPQ